MITKFIMVLLVATCLLSYTTETKAQNYDGTSKYKVQLSPTLIGAVAGSGFIILGALTTADLKWVPDNTSNSSTFYGQQGHWRKERVWESPTKTAAIISGIMIMGLSLTLSF